MLFSKKKVSPKFSQSRNFKARLASIKIAESKGAFHINFSGNGLIAHTEKGDQLFNNDLVGGAFKKIPEKALIYYSHLINDTTVLYDEKSSTLFRFAPNEDTFRIKLNHNEGYPAYCNGSIYYNQADKKIDKEFTQEVRLLRYNIDESKVDTFFFLNQYLKKLHATLFEGYEFSNILSGRFFNLKDDQVAFLPAGINRIFLIKNLKIDTLVPKNDLDIIRWRSKETVLPNNMGRYISFEPVNSGSSRLFLGIGILDNLVAICTNISFKEKEGMYYNVDNYDLKTYRYMNSYKIMCNDEVHLISIAMADNVIYTLDMKGKINRYDIK